jgi:hypothetical protein
MLDLQMAIKWAFFHESLIFGVDDTVRQDEGANPGPESILKFRSVFGTSVRLPNIALEFLYSF